MPNRKLVDRSQVLPFPGATDYEFRLARSFAVLVDWTAALNGRVELTDVLQVLTRQTEAVNLSLYRFRRPRSDLQTIAAITRKPDAIKPDAVSGNLIRFALKTRPETVLAGAVVRLGAARADAGFAGSEAQHEWAARPNVSEVSSIILEVTEAHIDVLELSFEQLPSINPSLRPKIVIDALCHAWSLRRPGFVTQLLARNGVRGDAPRNAEDVLGASNPFALSRSEIKIAVLLASGVKPKEIAEHLGLSIATVRTHLSKLYSKTQTQGQAELAALITRNATFADAPAKE